MDTKNPENEEANHEEDQKDSIETHQKKKATGKRAPKVLKPPDNQSRYLVLTFQQTRAFISTQSNSQTDIEALNDAESQSQCLYLCLQFGADQYEVILEEGAKHSLGSESKRPSSPRRLYIPVEKPENNSSDGRKSLLDLYEPIHVVLLTSKRGTESAGGRAPMEFLGTAVLDWRQVCY